jgi:hypothetical protein
LSKVPPEPITVGNLHQRTIFVLLKHRRLRVMLPVPRVVGSLKPLTKQPWIMLRERSDELPTRLLRPREVTATAILISDHDQVSYYTVLYLREVSHIDLLTEVQQNDAAATGSRTRSTRTTTAAARIG